VIDVFSIAFQAHYNHYIIHPEIKAEYMWSQQLQASLVTAALELFEVGPVTPQWMFQDTMIQ
jgi:hypothetical protein